MDAARRGVAITVVSLPEASPREGAARKLGVAAGEIVTSLVDNSYDDKFLPALIPPDRQISWPKLRAVVVNKSTLPIAESALGSATARPVFTDERARLSEWHGEPELTVSARGCRPMTSPRVSTL